MSSGFEWVVSPKVIEDGLDQYAQRALVVIHAAATKWGQDNQNQARENAKWEDRTGHARSGLFFAVDGFGFNPIYGEVEPDPKSLMNDVAVESGDANTLIVTLGHTVFYGKYLETHHGEIYAIVMSTLEGNLPNLERDLRDLFSG
jgi:hypothetical protein